MPMYSCPHCRNPLPDPVPASCPVCFGAIAAPSAAGSSATSGARLTHTGEVIPLEAPPPPPPLSGTGRSNPVQAPPMPTHAVAATAPGYRRTAQRETMSYGTKDRALFINLTVVFILVAAMGGGGWWMWSHRTNPKAQVERYLHAIQWLDWGVVWDLSAERPGGQSRHNFINKMDEPYEGNGVIRIGAR